MDGRFKGLLNDCVDKMVKVQRHGPDNVEGVLRYCGSDFVAVESRDGDLVLYPSTAIEALGMVVEGPPAGPEDDESHPDYEAVSNCSCLLDVLEAYEKSMITVGRQGPGTMRGLLLEVNSDFISMMSDLREIVHVPLWHLRSVTVGGKRPKSEDDKSSSSGNGNGSAWAGLWGGKK